MKRTKKKKIYDESITKKNNNQSSKIIKNKNITEQNNVEKHCPIIKNKRKCAKTFVPKKRKNKETNFVLIGIPSF